MPFINCAEQGSALKLEHKDRKAVDKQKACWSSAVLVSISYLKTNAETDSVMTEQRNTMVGRQTYRQTDL